MTQLSNITNLTGVLTYQSIPPPPPPSGAPNSLGFSTTSHPEKDLVLLLLSNYWPLARDSAAVQRSTQTLLDAIEALTAERKLKVRYTYMNYAALWQDPLGGYGSEQV